MMASMPVWSMPVWPVCPEKVCAGGSGRGWGCAGSESAEVDRKVVWHPLYGKQEEVPTLSFRGSRSQPEIGEQEKRGRHVNTRT